MPPSSAEAPWTATSAPICQVDATVDSDQLLSELLVAAKALKGVDIVASQSSPACLWWRDGYLIRLAGHDAPQVQNPVAGGRGPCNIASPPFLYRMASVHPPVTRRSPAYEALAMSMQTFEWWLRQNGSRLPRSALRVLHR